MKKPPIKALKSDTSFSVGSLLTGVSDISSA